MALKWSPPSVLISSTQLPFPPALHPPLSPPYPISWNASGLTLLTGPNCRQALPHRPSWCAPCLPLQLALSPLLSPMLSWNHNKLLPISHVSHIFLPVGLSQSRSLWWTHIHLFCLFICKLLSCSSFRGQLRKALVITQGRWSSAVVYFTPAISRIRALTINLLRAFLLFS